MVRVTTSGKTFWGPASSFKRIIAFVIDLLIVNLVIAFPLSQLVENTVPDPESFSDVLSLLEENAAKPTLEIVGIIISIVTILYFVLMEKQGQSIGKMIMKLKVVSDTKQLAYWQLLVRSIFMLQVFPFVLLYIIDPIVLLFDKHNRRLTEILSKTRVVQEYPIM